MHAVVKTLCIFGRHAFAVSSADPVGSRSQVISARGSWGRQAAAHPVEAKQLLPSIRLLADVRYDRLRGSIPKMSLQNSRLQAMIDVGHRDSGSSGKDGPSARLPVESKISDPI